jgi:hypothetical protein
MCCWRYNGWWSIAHHSYILHRNTTVSIFTYTSHDKLVKFVSLKVLLLPYCPWRSCTAAHYHIHAPVPPTLLTVICEMSCEQNTLVAAVVKVIELALLYISSLAVHTVVLSVINCMCSS